MARAVVEGLGAAHLNEFRPPRRPPRRLKKKNDALRGTNQTVLFEHMISSPHMIKRDDWTVHLDFLTDLHLMAECDGLVGKFTSNVDRIVLALMGARSGCVRGRARRRR